jgi:hypothetical protein
MSTVAPRPRSGEEVTVNTARFPILSVAIAILAVGVGIIAIAATGHASNGVTIAGLVCSLVGAIAVGVGLSRI